MLRSMTHERQRLCARLVIVCMLAFVICIAIAMGVYPGGTWRNTRHAGHDFWQNYLCDLLHDPALNHQTNTLGSHLATWGMLSFVVGLTVFWSLAPASLCCHAAWARLVRALGVFGTPLVSTVALLPSDHFPRLHTAAVTLGGLPAVAALVVFAAAAAFDKHFPQGLRLLTVGVATLVVVCLSLYVREAVFRAPPLWALPVLERLATMAAVIWVLVSLPRNPPLEASNRPLTG